MMLKANFIINFLGAVAQLGERMTGSHKVRGSIPLSSIKYTSNMPTHFHSIMI